MTREIRESDWKVFRQLHDVALARFCERVLAELRSVASEDGKSAHERYLAAYKLIHDRDRDLADAFNAMRRSTAYIQLAIIRSRGLLTDEEFARFSPEAREVVGMFLGS